jgi:hypothetical protein
MLFARIHGARRERVRSKKRLEGVQGFELTRMPWGTGSGCTVTGRYVGNSMQKSSKAIELLFFKALYICTGVFGYDIL